MNQIKRKLKGILTGTFLLLFSLLLVSCANTPKSSTADSEGTETTDSVTSPVAINSKVNYDEKKRIVSSEVFKIEFKESSLKKDIDDKESWFVFAEMTNLGKEVIFPEDIWNTHIQFSESKKGNDNLYQNVLPKKDLDGSDFKTAIDNMSKTLEPNKSVRIGSLYGLPTTKKVYLSVLDDDMEIVHTSEFKID